MSASQGPGDEDGDGHHDDKPTYGSYQIALYTDALISGKKPVVTTDPNKLEQAAREKMSPEAFNYVFGGAGEQSTVSSNRQAFRQWKLIPRMLRPTVPRNLSIKLFGKTYGGCVCQTVPRPGYADVLCPLQTTRC
jgi:hypothetical protein